MKGERQRERRNMLKKINVMMMSHHVRKEKKLLFVMCDEDDNDDDGEMVLRRYFMLSNRSNFEFKSNIQLDSIGAESEIRDSNQSSCSRLLVLPVALTLS